MTEYARLKRIHDNLISAAIATLDENMQKIWLHKASIIETKIKELEGKSIESLF